MRQKPDDSTRAIYPIHGYINETLFARGVGQGEEGGVTTEICKPGNPRERLASYFGCV